MIKRIKVHNYLNGHIFSLVEYLVVAVILTPFLVYYLAHGSAVYGLVTSGVILNCLTVAHFALASTLRREPSIGLLKFSRDPEMRKKIAIEHPDLSRDTLILGATVLIPFWIFGAVVVDGLSRHAER
jgi:hypothetical protein